MTKYLNLNDVEISNETLHILIDFYNELTDDDEAVIYFSSNGGAIDTAYQIRNILNTEGDRTVLYCGHQLASIAFWIFITAECEKVIYPYVSGLYHMAGAAYRFVASKTFVHDGEKFQIENIDPLLLKDTKEFMAIIGMTDKEQRDILKGKDVFFTPAQMAQFVGNYAIAKHESLPDLKMVI